MQRGSLLLLVIFSCMFAPGTSWPQDDAALPGVDADGWYRWTVAAGDPDQRRCCYGWRRHDDEWQPGCGGCRLDRYSGIDVDERAGSARPDPAVPANHVVIYARFDDGNLHELRALSADCPVANSTPVSDLGARDAAQSRDWLAARISASRRLRDEILAAIAAHDGAMETLTRVIEDRDFGRQVRNQALYWLAQSNDDDAFAYIDGILAAPAGQ